MTKTQQQYRTLILATLLHDIGKLLIKSEPEADKKHSFYAIEFLQQQRNLLQVENFTHDIDFDLLCNLVQHHHHKPEAGHAAAEVLDILRKANGYSAGEQDLEHVYTHLATSELALKPIFRHRYLGRPLKNEELYYQPQPLSPAHAFPQADLKKFSSETYAAVQTEFGQAFRYALENAEDWTALETWIYSLLERYAWAIPSDFGRDPYDVSLFDHSRTSCAIAAALYLGHINGVGPDSSQFLLIKGDVSGVQDYIYSVANVGPGGVAKRLRARSFYITALTEVVAHRLRDELVDDYKLPVAATIFSGGGQFVLLAPNLPTVQNKLTQIKKEINTWLWQKFQGDLAFVFGTKEISGDELTLTPDNQGRNICQALGDLDRQVEAGKEQRLETTLQAEGKWQPAAFKWAFPDQNYEHGTCPSCERLPARADANEEDIDNRLCNRCYADRQLSERIVGARYIAYWRDTPLEEKETGWLKQRRLTFFEGETRRHVVLLSALDELQKKLKTREQPYQLDGFGYETPQPDSPPLVRHFANYVPRFDNFEALKTFCTSERGCVYVRYDDNDACGILVRPNQSHVTSRDYPILQNFGCLSAASAEKPAFSSAEEPDKKKVMGAQLLGILRADVDHLRLLFSESFEAYDSAQENGNVQRSARSLSRLATLSRMIDLFFSGWVHEALLKPPYNKIYTVYTGGDDLCLVGPWDVLIDFARHLAEEFARYVGHNPNITLSAALTVTKPKFPLATSAKVTGELLTKAKSAGRHRFNMFGVIARWHKLPPYEDLSATLAEQLKEQEKHASLLVDDLWIWAKRLDDQLSHYRLEKEAHRHYPISRAFIHRLLHYAEMAYAWERNAQIKAGDMLYLAHLAYDLGRNIIKSGAVAQDVEKNLMELTQLQHRKLMAGMRMPITYALYRNRERSLDNDS
ncbi:MAG: type III-A CRISPR-associated protein Cas10/Csm1 [Chloroflexi bacterium]|nr:type III-A CRISPR-associated protein Cas10/Csm1 [Chloroflexota bacterium]